MLAGHWILLGWGDVLLAARDEGVLETEEIKDVAHTLTGACVAIARVRIARDETVLETEKIEYVKFARACARIAIGVAGFGLGMVEEPFDYEA